MTQQEEFEQKRKEAVDELAKAIPLQPFFTIRFEHMLSLGCFRYRNYDKIRPGGYIFEISFLFMLIEWGRI